MNEAGPGPEELQRTESAKRLILRRILSKAAAERLARVKLVKPELAGQLELYLMDLYQSGKVRGEVSEEQMKMILETISGGGKREIKIIRK